MEDKNRQVIFLLGMKNCGLGLLEQSLKSSNVFFGMDDAFRESQFLKEYGEKVLISNGGTWDNPPFKVKFSAYQKQLFDLFVENFSEHKILGINDFRSTLLINAWEAIIPNFQTIGIFCHPSIVVDMYKENFNFPSRLSFELYIKYNKKLLARFEKKPYPIIELGLQEDQYNKSIEKACQQIGLELKPKDLKLDESILSYKDIRELNKEVMKVYRRMLEVKISL